MQSVCNACKTKSCFFYYDCIPFDDGCCLKCALASIKEEGSRLGIEGLGLNSLY